MGDEIGGHHVSGHVHTIASIEQIESTEDNRCFKFKVCITGSPVRRLHPVKELL